MSHFEVEKVVRSTNFYRSFSVFKLDPEAIALELFRPTTPNSTEQENPFSPSDAQKVAQGFCFFLLRQLGKEMDLCMDSKGLNADRLKSSTLDLKESGNLISEMFGFYVRTCTTFLHSGTKKIDRIKAPLCQLDLLYPAGPPDNQNRRKTGQPLSPPKKENKSFAAVLWSSFRKEINMKGWCQESESYEPFRREQSLLSLPPVLTLHCADTFKEIRSALTLASALQLTTELTHAATSTAENAQSLFWAPPLKVALEEQGVVDFYWLPVEVEIGFYTDVGEGEQGSFGSEEGFYISCRCVPVEENQNGEEQKNGIWIIFNGNEEVFSNKPASLGVLTEKIKTHSQWVFKTYTLHGIISMIVSPAPTDFKTASTATPEPETHFVLHLQKPNVPSTDSSSDSPAGKGSHWYLFNDYMVEHCTEAEALAFPSFRHPVTLFLHQQQSSQKQTTAVPSESETTEGSRAELLVPASVLQLESLSSVEARGCEVEVAAPERLIAFDAEFVSVSQEVSFIDMSGERKVSQEGRKMLARISLLDGGNQRFDVLKLRAGETKPLSDLNLASTSTVPEEGYRVLVDDYIFPLEPVVDYLTRFSGITAEDLNPVHSKHSLITHRAAYLKLRYFIDRKCIFVGHGLQMDFQIANIFIPPEQIRDTVELWRLPNQRKISLRFLAAYFLNIHIQDEVHDSIEDAKTALLLYRHYETVAEKGTDHLQATLMALYQFGSRTNWTIGMERIHLY